jgi:hypothetical protein
MIDSVLLDDFMRRFFGYGSWDAKLWSLGMEEGGGGSKEEIERRFAAWDRSDDLADAREYHAAVGGMRWFDERPKIQSTWAKLIRVTLAATGRDTDTESVRRYQRDAFGRRGGELAVIELLPLPSPSTSRWLYESYNIPEISTRDRYRKGVLPQRIKAIRERIEKHRPAVVVFHGIAYRKYWEEIIGRRFTPRNGERFETASDGNTRFALAPHPVAKGVSNADFEAIGRWIRDTG